MRKFVNFFKLTQSLTSVSINQESKRNPKFFWSSTALRNLKDKKPIFVLSLDFDDTIVKYSPTISKCISKAQEDLIKDRIATSFPLVPKFFDKSYEESLEESFLEYKTIGKNYYKRHFDAYTGYPKYPAIPGALQFLRKILDDNIKVAIITNNTTTGVWKNLLEHVFSNIPEDKKKIDHISTNSLEIAKVLKSLPSSNLTDEQQKWRDIILDIIKSKNFVIVGRDLGVEKPHYFLGEKALSMLNISLTNLITVCHVGDGLNSDRLFAKNFDLFLKEKNPQSSCQFIYFGLQFDFITDKIIINGDLVNGHYKTIFDYESIVQIIQQNLNMTGSESREEQSNLNNSI